MNKKMDIYDDKDVEISEMDIDGELEDLQKELGEGFHAEVEYKKNKKEEDLKDKKDTDSIDLLSSGRGADFF